MLLLFLLLVAALVILPPIINHYRERALGERLKQTRDPHEAMAMMDAAMRQSKGEGDFLKRLRHSYFFWL